MGNIFIAKAVLLLTFTPMVLSIGGKNIRVLGEGGTGGGALKPGDPVGLIILCMSTILTVRAVFLIIYMVVKYVLYAFVQIRL